MRFTNFSEIRDLSDGLVIEGIKGTVKKVYKRNKGEGQYGPYSYQDIELTDGQLTVTVNVGNHDDLSQYKGKFICLLSTKDDKGKMNGLTITDKEYRGNVSRIIKANVRCEITETQPASQLQQLADAPPENETQAQRTLREHREGKPTSTSAAKTTEAHKPVSAMNRLGQRTTLMFYCRRAAWAVAKRVNELNANDQPSEETIAAMTAQLYKSSSDEGLDLQMETNFIKANQQ